jgi:thiol-disulfide isomerase/thioredoxin
MALTPSNQITLDTQASDFTLIDTISGKELSFTDTKGINGTVIMFICNHCPFVIHINEKIVELATEFQAQGINFIAISSNNAENFPQDGPTNMTIHAERNNYNFPYLYDETQSVAKDYQAACTPDIFVFDENEKLYYHGQIDDSRPGNNKPATGADLQNALTNLLQKKSAPTPQKPSIGCNIKWN